MREAAHLVALRTEIAAGRPEDALRRFDALARMLRETADAAPGAEARGLEADARRLLAARSSGTAAPSPAPAKAPEPASSDATRTPSPVPLTLPMGTVAMLATDIERSTGMGRTLGEEQFAQVLARHHALLRAEFARTGGIEFHEAGDGFWVAFPAARDALICARACQQAIMAGFDDSDGTPPVRVRMAIHVADLRFIDRDDSGVPDGQRGTGAYRGLALHDLGRLLPAAHGGQIFLSEAAEAVLRREPPDGIVLADRGVFRLRDSPAPEHIFEALWDGATDAAHSLAPKAPRPRTPVLPPSFTKFFGRDDEITAIAAALGDGETRLLTLTGMGGAGKTRLAAEAARCLIDDFAGAVYFVPLVGTDDPARLPDAVRAVVAADVSGDVWDALATAFRDDRWLVVLDNLEHLLTDAHENGVCEFLQTLLERFPRVACLATSRQRIGLAAEQEFPVRPLPTPKATTDSAPLATTAPQALRFASVALFQDRARRAKFDFQVTERNASAVAMLCARLEGIPLGLELAAAWARLLTPAEMLVQFDDIRRSRDRALPDRHRSLDAAIEGSYRLLDDDQRAFFRALSVFRGGWPLDAAKAVCDDPMALALLAELRDRSLIVVDEDGDGSRYRFLETVRAFATARLDEDPDQCDACARRHTAWYAALAADANDALQGPDQAAWLTRLAAEHQNLAAVLDRTDRPNRLQMAGHLHRYWIVRGYLAEGRKWLADALEPDTSVPDAVAHKAINVAGVLAMTAGDLDAAKPLFATYAERCQSGGDEKGSRNRRRQSRQCRQYAGRFRGGPHCIRIDAQPVASPQPPPNAGDGP